LRSDGVSEGRRTILVGDSSFTASLTVRSPYADVEIPDPQEFWEWLTAEIRGRSPLWSRCQALWGEFNMAQQVIRQELDATDWSNVPGTHLVELAYHAIGVNLGIAGYLPPTDDMDPAFRRGLYVQVLILQALTWQAERRIPICFGACARSASC